MQSGNYRMTEFQAAILITQLARLNGQIELRDKNAQYMEKALEGMEGIKTLFRNPNITKQAYFRWTLKYDSKSWENVPRDKFLQALSAELENSFQCSLPYEPLNNSPFYQPYSKKTHRLSEEYWKEINPQRFVLPECTKAYEEEAFCFYHSILLSDKAGCDNIVGAMRKLRENIGELVEFSGL